MARTTATYGVARPLRGGSTRSSHRATCPTAFNDTISFRRASCRARCASVHIGPLSQPTMFTAGSDRDQDCSVPIEHKMGEVSVEKMGVQHWWKNTSKSPVVLLSADLFHDEKYADDHVM